MKQTEVTFQKLAYIFIEEFSALIEDFSDITKNKAMNLKEVIGNKIKNKEISKEDYFYLIDDNTKHRQFRYAMFNYMNSLFEKHINELFVLAIKKNKKIRDNYVTKFIELDKEKIQKNLPSIRNTEYEKMSANKKIDLQLKFMNEITHMLPPLHNWQYFFDIKDQKMWVDPNLKFDFTEMKARRNLLTHRNTYYDEEYINSIQNAVKNSKKISDPAKRIEEYHNNMFFFFTKDKHKTLNDLIGKNSRNQVSISVNYFTKSFFVLINIYFILSNHATNSNTNAINFSHELLVLGKKLGNALFYFMALKLTLNQINSYSFANDDMDLVKVNYLLAFREVGKILRFKNAELLSKEIYKDYLEYYSQETYKDYLEYFKNKKDPIYKLLIYLLDDDLDSCLLVIKQIKDLKEEHKRWFIYSDLLTYKNFDEIFKSTIAKNIKAKK